MADKGTSVDEISSLFRFVSLSLSLSLSLPLSSTLALYVSVIPLFARFPQLRRARIAIELQRKGIGAGPRSKGPVARVKWSPHCRNYRGNETTPVNSQRQIPRE